MSSRNPVIWHEGLFVKPQHFQQQARAAEAAVHQRLHSLNDALYGFSELTLVTRQAAGSTKAYLLFFCAAGALYLMITLVSNVLIGFIERHYRRGMVRPA